jgi:hypothetical protein
MWVDVLIDAGVDVALPSPDEVRLNKGPALRLVTLDRPLRGRDLNGLGGPGLLVATRIGPTLRARLQANAWSWVAEDAQAAHVAGLDIVVGQARETTDPGARPRWPRGHATFAIMRALLLAGRADQATLAGCADCSQPLVSRTLRRLADDGLVHGRRGEWRPGPDLARWWLDRYPGPGGTTLHLWAPGRPWDNAETLVDACDQEGVDVTLTGAVAADATSPWTDPARVTAYVNRTPSADRGDLVESSDPEAPIRLVVPADHRITATRAASQSPAGRRLWVTDPLVTAWAVRDEAGRSAEDQIERLLALLPNA